MNINMANLRYLDLFRSSNIAGRLCNAKVSNGARIADAKTPKDTFGCSVSISEESKTMLEQSNEEKKQSEQDVISENESYTIDPEGYIILEVTNSNASNKNRMLHAALQCQCNDTEKVGTFSFDKLASSYKEIRKELESEYTGQELEEHLNLLDEEYIDTVDYITNRVKKAINCRGAREGKEGIAKAIEALFGKNINDMNDMLSQMGLEKDQSIKDPIDAFVNSIDVIIKFLAKKARESDN